MSMRSKVAGSFLKMAGVLSKADFGNWESFLKTYGNDKQSGEILWNDYVTQRRKYKGTTFACIRKIAPAVAAAKLHLYIPKSNSGIRAVKRRAVDDETHEFLLSRPHCKAIMDVNEDVEEVISHPGLDVFTRAGSAMNRYQLFDKTMMLMILNGNCYWLPILNKTGAYPVEITFIMPEKIKPMKGNDGRVNRYIIKGNGTEDNPEKTYELDEIIHFWYPNPYSDVEGFSPVSAASMRISAEENIITVQNTTLDNMGIPPFIVNVLARMPPEQFKEFKNEFVDMYSGMKKRGKPFFTSGDWEIKEIAQTLEEMGYIEGSKLLREFIANDLGVPQSKLTMESSNRAVAEAGNTEFLRDTILPNLTMIAEELTESLITMFPVLKDTGAFYMFDNPVPEDMKNKMLMRRVNRTTGVTTPNEERQADGLDPHPSEEADQLAPVRAPMLEPSDSQAEAARAIDAAMDRVKMGIEL